ncbi:MAG: RecB family exonuclease [Bdellovibrionales bacterium]
MMKIYEEVKSYYENDFGTKTLVVSTEAQSLQVKELLFDLGAEIVSDRDIVTLDYLLTQNFIQQRGGRIIDDFLYPYVQEGEEVGVVAENIKWVKNFPDPFVESEIFDVLTEYFGENEETKRSMVKLKEVFDFSNKTLAKKVIPRSFIKLGINELLSSDKYILLDSLLKELPVGFQEEFSGGVLQSSSQSPYWAKQIDLYKVLKDHQDSIKVKNFSSQIEEVRFVLEALSKGNEGLFLFPRNQGYENLLFIYQREFFKEQVFFYPKREKSFLRDCILKLRNKTESIETSYSSEFVNKNTIRVSEKENVKICYNDVLRFFEGRFTEYDLNLLSPVAQQIDVAKEIPISDWVEILTEIERKEEAKFKKLSTNLAVKDYSFFSVNRTENLYIMGWGDFLFKKNGEKLFSNTVLSGLERDLGLDLVSLNKSTARELMANPLFYNEEIKKHILSPEKTASGSSIKPGVFKILWDKDKIEIETSRVKTQQTLETVREKLLYKDKKLSASSLQRYDECPYKFYMEKVLKFNFEEEEDYFLSPKEEGLLIHKALEEVSNDNLTKARFKDLIEEMIYTQEEEFNHFRKSSLEVFVDHLWEIIQSENEYLKKVGAKSVESEKFFSFSANVEDKVFVKEGGDFKISGVVDRIDVSPLGEAFLYDYKRADTGSVSLGRYSGAKLSPQLFLYCIALDKGFLGNFKDFLGFQYINVKAYKRSKGFVDKENGASFAKEVPHGSAVTVEKYQEKLELFLSKFWEVLNRIMEGDFQESPNPVYSGACTSCTWVGTCKKSETFQ